MKETPVDKGVARGVSRLPGTPPPKKKIIHRPNWVKPRGERFGGQLTVVGNPPPRNPPPNSVLLTPLPVESNNENWFK